MRRAAGIAIVIPALALLIHGAASGRLSTFRKVFDKADLNRRLADAVTDAKMGDDIERVRILLRMGGGPNARTGRGPRLLHLAVYFRERRIAEFLITSGARIDAMDDNGLTPMHVAVERGSAGMVGLLAAHGADVNGIMKSPSIGGAGDLTPLHVAALHGHGEVARALIAAGARVDAKGPFGIMPLHYAAACGATDVAKALIAGGADVNARDGQGRTALHFWALNRQSREFGEFLLAHGVEINAKDGTRHTALDRVRDPGIAAFLRVQGAKRGSEIRD